MIAYFDDKKNAANTKICSVFILFDNYFFLRYSTNE